MKSPGKKHSIKVCLCYTLRADLKNENAWCEPLWKQNVQDQGRKNQGFTSGSKEGLDQSTYLVVLVSKQYQDIEWQI